MEIQIIAKETGETYDNFVERVNKIVLLREKGRVEIVVDTITKTLIAVVSYS